jgi:hypothetical protein
VTLVAASKHQPVEALDAARAAGQVDFGENYVQEALDKQDQLGRQGLRWHFIGRLQRNKAKFIPGHFDLVHSVDSAKLARMLDKRSGEFGRPQDVLLQINLAGEKQKGGVSEQDLWADLEQIQQLPNLVLKGFMTMPPFFDAPDKVRPYFKQLRKIREQAQERTGLSLPQLSMGMSGDFEAAIAEGATLVRVGSRIFGPRACLA